MQAALRSQQASLYLRFLRTYLQPLARRSALLFVIFLAAVGIELWLPRVLAGFIDQALAGESLEALLRTAALFLGGSVLVQSITVAETYLATEIGLTATNRLRADLTRHCLNLDLTFHNHRTPGELIERVDGDAGVLNRFFSRFIVQVAGSFVLLLGVLILLFAIDWRVGTGLAAFTALTLFLLGRLSAVAIPYWNEAKEARAQVYGFIEERLSGTEDLRANGAVPYALRGLADKVRRYFRKDIVANAIGSAAFGTTIMLFTIGGAISLGLAAWVYLEGSVSLGTAYLIVSYTLLLTRPIESITRELDDLQEAGASLRRVNELLGERSGLSAGSRTLPPGPLGVRLERVSFTYPDAQAAGSQGASVIPGPALGDVSFSLAAGRALGLLGRTGSGKTTLTRLLFRLYDPTAGQILLEGVPLGEAAFDSVRYRVGMVTQEVHLFNATVRENLTFFDPQIRDGDIRRALAELDLLDWVEGFPEGLDTMLQPGGEGFSAGEAQLLAFARVFLKDPGLIILDEASSRLDPATEARLERAIGRLLAGRTAVIIAHRLETVRRADDILILDGGRILEHGQRAALAGDPGSRFARLLATGLEAEMA